MKAIAIAVIALLHIFIYPLSDAEECIYKEYNWTNIQVLGLKNNIYIQAYAIQYNNLVTVFVGGCVWYANTNAVSAIILEGFNEVPLPKIFGDMGIIQPIFVQSGNNGEIGYATISMTNIEPYKLRIYIYLCGAPPFATNGVNGFGTFTITYLA
ncbi:MAG: hypothetical protein ACYCPT_12245 [Acidimicrobiales bacterium]